MKREPRLVLGTAQLGSSYGIANRFSLPNPRTSEAVVEAALEGGIWIFDTAHAYGQSESILGNVFRRLKIENMVRVCSKIGTEIDFQSYPLLEKAVESSLERLGLPELFCLLLHKESLIDHLDQQVMHNLRMLLEKGLVQRIGISLYSPEKALQALRTDLFSNIQIPSNLLDRRFETAGVFQEAERLGKTVYVRSVFLQGLLLMTDKDIPDRMRFAKPMIFRLAAIANGVGLRREALLLGYVKHIYPSANVIFGAESPQQIRDNLRYWNTEIPNGLVFRLKEQFKDVEDRILNPNLWPSIEQDHLLTTQ